ncbi:MAG: hypothetical protein JWL70_1908 [Acidimicrobiia bacterium]|nr:hypothetical protein [Acidimicrobiia bacterium]
MRRREDLATPRERSRLGIHYDPEAFGNFSEAIARYLGTARFLVMQTVLCIFWVSWNYLAPRHWQFDPSNRGLVLLTLALSLQAAYAAPLILLAQNRQEDRERTQSERDREITFRTQAETEFLAREVASIRLALSDVVNTDDLAEQFDRLLHAIERLDDRGRPDEFEDPEPADA